MLSGGAAPCFDLYHALLHERPHEPDQFPQALADLGHVVDVSKADPFTLPGASQGDAVAGAGADGVEGGGGPGFEFADSIIRGPVTVVDSTGKVVRVIRN